MGVLCRPIACDAVQGRGEVLPLAGLKGVYFDQVEALSPKGDVQFIGRDACPVGVVSRLSAPRADVAGISLDRPRIMGIVNVTPDSFSDGGRYNTVPHVLSAARDMALYADILDIGGESTRPGAEVVSEREERARVIPVIKAIRDAGLTIPISIDTRKASVGFAALQAGANMINDVSALQYDPEMAAVAAQAGCPICLMHAQGTPDVMQDDPRYRHVIFDVYHALEARIEGAVACGVAREKIIVDPGIGFGKTQAHNLELMRKLGVFHGLGLPVLLGVSRKRFIGDITQVKNADERIAGSLTAGLYGLSQGVHILRVHDVLQTRQALQMQEALAAKRSDER